jgi:hypothetical protein
MARIVVRDNFDRENVSEYFHGGVMSEAEAKLKADELNKRGGDFDPNFYAVVPDDYKLCIWEP